MFTIALQKLEEQIEINFLVIIFYNLLTLLIEFKCFNYDES